MRSTGTDLRLRKVAAFVGVVCLVTAANLGAASPAVALEPSVDDGTDDASGAREAAQRFREGKDLFERGRYADARVKFIQACSAHRTKSCPKNLGVTAFALGDTASATTHLREFLRDPDVAAEDPSLARLKKMYDEAFAKSGHLEVEANAGAEIAVDSHRVGTAPLGVPIDVPAGTHLVEVRIAAARSDAALLREQVDVHAGETLRLWQTAKEGANSGVVSAGAGQGLRVASASVAAADSLTGATTSDGASPPARPSAARWATTGVVAGAGIVALAVGVGFLVGASSAADDASRASASLGSGANACAGAAKPTACGDLANANSDERRDKSVGWVGVASGAGLVAGAFATWLLWPTAAGKGTAWMSPDVSVSSHGASARVGVVF